MMGVHVAILVRVILWFKCVFVLSDFYVFVLLNLLMGEDVMQVRW